MYTNKKGEILIKKLLIVTLVVALGIMILFGCSNNSNKKNETINDSSKSLNHSNSKNDNNKKGNNESPNETNDKSNNDKKVNSTKNVNNNDSDKSKNYIFLSNIKSHAIKGQVINSSYKLGDSINSVIKANKSLK